MAHKPPPRPEDWAYRRPPGIEEKFSPLLQLLAALALQRQQALSDRDPREPLVRRSFPWPIPVTPGGGRRVKPVWKVPSQSDPRKRGDV